MSFGGFGSSSGGFGSSDGGGGNPFGASASPFGSGGSSQHQQGICMTCGANRAAGGLCTCAQAQAQQQGFGAFGVQSVPQQQPNLPQNIPIIICDHIFSVPCDGTPINQVVASILKQIGQQ